ncbi:MAG: hypothetical protein DRP94_04950 [Candidatus Latescibacterota bacterium]|nr:MAG: hypothetical protein DRP94_04950 [Candidatus Latescibacterota bacterium]RKY63649.1 MAG: hypothetical protein DRQ08_09195 [Candidatus Latescibacterota bacterium]HDH99829.1 hypothetical protein [Bacillota bacterium]
MSPELLGAWVAAGLTLAIFSFLYKDNPFFKFGEHLYIGISVGYSITLLVFNFMIPKWWTPLFREGRMSLLVPTVLGLLIWTRFFPRFSWLSRWAFAFVVGFGAGIAIPRTISNFIFRQVESTAVPLVSRGQQGVSFGWGDFSNFLIAFGVLSVLTYFFFSVEHKGPIRPLARAGVLFLMVSFGASFGYTVMARVSLLFGRMYDLVEYSSRGYGYATLVLLGLMVAVFLAQALSKKREGG